MINAFCYVPAILGLLWSVKEWVAVAGVKIDGHPDLLAKQDSKASTQAKEIVEEMTKIAQTISDGAMSFLFAEYLYMAVYIVLFSIVLYIFTDVPTTVSFVVGA